MDALTNLGGRVESDYDYQYNSFGYDQPATPKWLRGVLENDFFSDPFRLSFSNTTVTDVGLEHIKGLTKLNTLDLNNTQVTDAGLEYLKGLTQLEDLDLENT